MQINSPQNAAALYSSQQVAAPQVQPAKSATSVTSNKADNALTVSISPAAQALQKEAASQQMAVSKKTDTDQVVQQQVQQQLQSQRPAAKAQRIDISI
ncbi:MAG: hypothetical protein PHI06_08045 [Desulfobulbaceae bacterium]|nr:hypothetical protein [Desulfobulbaceae bacterium]